MSKSQYSVPSSLCGNVFSVLQQDSSERAIPLLRSDLVQILSAATQTLLRRDMSLNRRLYAWLLGPEQYPISESQN